MHAPQYHETLFSRLYPGCQESSPCYLPTVQELQRFVGGSAAQRQHIVLRSDAGFGSDANLNQVLADDWQVLSKNKGGRRPGAFAARVPADGWHDLGVRRQWAALPQPLTYARPLTAYVPRWWGDQHPLKHAIVLCSITAWSPQEVMPHYDDRALCEVEIRNDKTGLQLERRRKKSLAAQEALILLTDVAHNVLAWTRHWMFPTGSLAGYGPLRLIEDVLCQPGHLIFEGDRLCEVQLNERHPHAAAVAMGLERLFDHFGPL